jgi:serine/threonine-protein kinase
MTERILNKRYALESKVGEGGMAVTWRAHDLLLNRTVAVKVMREQFTTDPHFVERFRREAQAAARLSHENIAGVYDTGSADGTYYIVMELVEGLDLKQRLRQHGPLPLLTTLDVGRQIAAALDAAHRSGLVHRDIKPHNILINADGKVKVTDFGIAKLATDGDDTGVIIGSVHYLSPEQARGEATTPVSDLYALGAVLFEALTGRTVFEGENAMAVAHKQNYERPPLPRTLRPDIPAAVETIVLRCLEKDPRARYQSAAELQAVLTQAHNALSQEQTVVIPAPAAPPAMDATMIYKKPAGAPAAPPPAPVQAAPPPVEERRGGGGGGWIIFFLFLILCGVVGYGAYLLGHPKPVGIETGTTGKTIVPDLVTQGLTAKQAQDLLTMRGFTYSESTEASNVEIGKICRQDPPAGAEVDPKSTKILYWVSDGPLTVVLPGVAGMSREAAAREIRRVGFKGTFTPDKKEFNDTVPKGMVLRTEPAEKGTVSRDAQVTLVLSKGPQADEQFTFRPGKAPDLGAETDYIRIEMENPVGSDPQTVWEGTAKPGERLRDQVLSRRPDQRVVVRIYAGTDETDLQKQSEEFFGPEPTAKPIPPKPAAPAKPATPSST